MTESDEKKQKHFNLVHHAPMQQQQQATGQPPFLNPEVPSTTATGGRITEEEARKINASVLHPEKLQGEYADLGDKLNVCRAKPTDPHQPLGAQQTEATPLNLSHEQARRAEGGIGSGGIGTGGIDKGQPVPVRVRTDESEREKLAREKEVEGLGAGISQMGLADQPKTAREEERRDQNLNEPQSTLRPVSHLQRTQAPITTHTLQVGVPESSSMGAGKHESTYEQPATETYFKSEVDGLPPLQRGDEGLQGGWGAMHKGTSEVRPARGATWEHARDEIDRSQFQKQT